MNSRLALILSMLSLFSLDGIGTAQDQPTDEQLEKRVGELERELEGEVGQGKHDQAPPTPEGPKIAIKCPPEVEIGEFVEVKIEETGGATRERYVWLDYKLCFPGGKNKNFRMDPGEKGFYFTAKPGPHTIRVLVIGEKKGYAEEETRVLVKVPAPAVPGALGASQDPTELIREWASRVNSPNRRAEIVEIAKSARETATAIRTGRVDGARAAEEWASSAYLRMGPAFAAWNVNPNGRSFFNYVAEMFSTNAKLPGNNSANLLDSLADILAK